MHYDPAYDRGRKKSARPVLGVLPVRPGDPADMMRAADEVARLTLAHAGATLKPT